MEPWTAINDGRSALAGYLDTLSPTDWAKPSLCAGWTVKDVAAHMLVIPTIPKGKVFRAFLGSGFNLDKMNAKFVQHLTSTMSNADIVTATRSSAASQSMPPGLKLLGVLTELAVHSGDLSDGVGTPFALPVADYVTALDYLKNVQPVFGSKKRVAGLTLRATDTSWSTGSGPVVEGTARDLLLAVAGRPSAVDRLSGDGVAALRAR